MMHRPRLQTKTKLREMMILLHNPKTNLLPVKVCVGVCAFLSLLVFGPLLLLLLSFVYCLAFSKLVEIHRLVTKVQPLQLVPCLSF